MGIDNVVMRAFILDDDAVSPAMALRVIVVDYYHFARAVSRYLGTQRDIEVDPQMQVITGLVQVTPRPSGRAIFHIAAPRPIEPAGPLAPADKPLAMRGGQERTLARFLEQRIVPLAMAQR